MNNIGNNIDINGTTRNNGRAGEIEKMLDQGGGSSGTGGWEITFSDMLTLLLTFFVFIIAISSFKVVEYKKFWDRGQALTDEPKEATTSDKFELIKGLNLPRLRPEAETLLGELESTFTKSDFDGVDVHYDENKISLMVSEQLSFEGGKYDLRKEVEPLLEKLIAPINKSTFDVSVEGHSDNLTHPSIDNMELSLRRALVVARFLMAKGVEKEKISVAGYGPYRPIVSNDTLEGRMINRRVEINIMINNE